MLGGAIEEMTPTTQASIRRGVAQIAGISDDAIDLSIVPGSIILKLKISAAGKDGSVIGQNVVDAWVYKMHA